nr:methyltransferase-like protein 22 isoform X2 [Equus asinus]
MDEVTFRSDTVLSDVHLYTPNQRHLMVRLNSMGQPVFLSRFKLLWNQDSWADSGVEAGSLRAVRAEETPPAGTGSLGSPPGSGHSGDGAGAQLDEDGDLDVVRRPRAASDLEPAGPSRDKVHPVILTQEEDDLLGDEAQESSPHDVIKIGPQLVLHLLPGPPAHSLCFLNTSLIVTHVPAQPSPPPGSPAASASRSHVLIQPEHTMATPLEDVGKQVWRGALLLADYILSQWGLFQGRTVLELGAGMGLTSIIAATVAQTVYCTDVGADLLTMCQRNIALNSHLTAAGGGVVKVKELDWLKDDLCTDPKVPFSWSEEDVSDLYSHTTILLAAEVFYDDDLTDALFKTLFRLTRKLKNACIAILSVEKRLNFTLRDLDVTCEAYDHFRSALRRLEKLADGRRRFVVEPVDASFPTVPRL